MSVGEGAASPGGGRGLNFCETQQIGIESMLLILVAWQKYLPG